MSLIASIKNYLLTYPGLVSAESGLLVDTLGKVPTQYSIVPLPGPIILESYLNDTELCQYPFAVQSMESIIDEKSRVANHEFYENLATWIKAQVKANNLPTLSTGKTPEGVEVLGTPALIQFGESGTGVYMLQLRILYRQIQGV